MVTQDPVNLLDIQLLLEEEHTSKAAPYAFGTSILPVDEEDAQIKTNRRSSTALSTRSMITKIYTAGSVWPQSILQGNDAPAGFLTLEKGDHDKIFMRYLAAPTIIGASSTDCPRHPFHLLGISNKAAFTRGQDLTGSNLSSSDMSYTAVSYHGKGSSTNVRSPFHLRSIPVDRHPQLRKKLTTMYPTIANSIVQKYNNEIHSTNEEDTGHCFFVDPPGNNKTSTLRVSLPAIFPVPRGSNFCLNSPVEIKALTTDANAALFKDTLMSKGTDDADFIVDDPVFRLWTIAAAGPHGYHLAAKSILEADFLSLPFKEHQSAALACGRLCIADRLFFTHGEEKLKDLFNANHQAAYASTPDEEDFKDFFENFPIISGKTPSITSISLLSSPRQGNIQASTNANHPFGLQKGHPSTSAASVSNTQATSFFKKALSQVNGNGIPVSSNGLSSKVIPSLQTIQNLGIIDYKNRPEFFPFTDKNQSFDLSVEDVASPTGFSGVTDKSALLLANLHPSLENNDPTTLVNMRKAEFQEAVVEDSSVNLYCQNCVDISKFFDTNCLGLLFKGHLNTGKLGSVPYGNWSPIHVLFLFPFVRNNKGIPLLPPNGFPQYQDVINFLGAVKIVTLNYLYDYTTAPLTILYQGLTSYMLAVDKSKLRHCWNVPSFNKGKQSIKVLEVVHNLWANVSTLATNTSPYSRHTVIQTSVHGEKEPILAIPSVSKNHMSSVFFDENMKEWHVNAINSFASVSSSITASTEEKFGHYLLAIPTDSLFAPRIPKRPLTPVLAAASGAVLLKKPKINKRPPAAPSGFHICDPVDLAIKLSELACSDKLSEAKGGLSRVRKGKNNPSGESRPSLLCKTYLFGLSCDGSTSCGYHLHVDEKSINGPPDSYQPLRDWFVQHKDLVKPSASAKANKNLFP